MRSDSTNWDSRAPTHGVNLRTKYLTRRCWLGIPQLLGIRVTPPLSIPNDLRSWRISSFPRSRRVKRFGPGLLHETTSWGSTRRPSRFASTAGNWGKPKPAKHRTMSVVEAQGALGHRVSARNYSTQMTTPPRRPCTRLSWVSRSHPMCAI